MNFPVFIWYVISTTFTPGPNNIMAMTTSSKYGFKSALRFALGVSIGFVVLQLLAAAFSALLYSAIPNVEIVMKIVGAAYILWLAFTIVRDKPHDEKEDSKKKHLRPDSVLTGAVLQFINPKAIIYSIVSMSTFILPYYKSPFMIALFAAILSLIALVSLSCWAIGGAAIEKVFSKHKKALNIVLALLLVYCAVALFL